MKKGIWILAAVVGLLILGSLVARQGTSSPAGGTPATSGSEQNRAQAPRSSRGQAPDFQVTDLNGKPLTLSALRGKVVLLDFWATWCPPCLAEIPHFRELYAAYKGQGLEMVGLALDEGGAAVVKPFVRDNDIQYLVGMGAAQITQAYGGIRGIPTTFLIDKQGRIAQKYVGYQEKQVFESQIRALLAE